MAGDEGGAMSDLPHLTDDGDVHMVDVGAKAEVYGIVRELTRKGRAVILVSSELPELLALSDRILVMREGELTAGFRPEKTTQEEILKHAIPA